MVVLLAVGWAAYHFGGAGKSGNAPGKITQISHWDKPMEQARLSPDGHTVAFSSPVNGLMQVFVILASGGEPLQTNSIQKRRSYDLRKRKAAADGICGGALAGRKLAVLREIAKQVSVPGKSHGFG